MAKKFERYALEVSDIEVSYREKIQYRMDGGEQNKITRSHISYLGLFSRKKQPIQPFWCPEWVHPCPLLLVSFAYDEI